MESNKYINNRDKLFPLSIINWIDCDYSLNNTKGTRGVVSCKNIDTKKMKVPIFQTENIKKDDIRRILKANQNISVSNKAFKVKYKLKNDSKSRIINSKAKTKIHPNKGNKQSSKSIKNFKENMHLTKDRKMRASSSRSQSKIKAKNSMINNKSRDQSYLRNKYQPYNISELVNSPLIDDNYMRLSGMRTSTNLSDSKSRKAKTKLNIKAQKTYYTSNSIPRSLANKLAGVLETSTRPISKNSKRNTESTSVQMPEKSSTVTPGNSICK